MLLKELNRKGKIFLNSAADFILPRFCSSCQIKLTSCEQVVCNSCLQNIQHASKERLDLEFKRKFANDNIISSFYSLYVFEKGKELQNIAHQLKYGGKYYVGKFFGRLMAANLAEIINEWNADLIIPIPLHPLKKAQRGYNQSYFLAKGISSILAIPVKTNLIKRKRFTESQTTMTFLERKENIRNAFKVKSANKVKGKRIILLDDIITTGATISECGKILLDSHANKIFALSFAIADSFYLEVSK